MDRNGLLCLSAERSPNIKKYSGIIEMVQRRAAHFTLGRDHMITTPDPLPVRSKSKIQVDR